MNIRNIYTNRINKVNSLLNPVSLTLPSDALSVNDLFNRYMQGTLERDRATLARRLEFDGYNPDIMKSDPNDLIDIYELSYQSSLQTDLTDTEDVVPTKDDVPVSDPVVKDIDQKVS